MERQKTYINDNNLSQMQMAFYEAFIKFRCGFIITIAFTDN